MKNKTVKGDFGHVSEYIQLMEGKITNKEFEDLTGLEPAGNNPSRKDWLKRKRQTK